MKFLYATILLLSSSSVFSSEGPRDTLKLSSDVEKEISGGEAGKNKGNVNINRSTRIKYPQSRRVYGRDFELENDSREMGKDLSYGKNEDAGIAVNNEDAGIAVNNAIEIRRSDKIQYPQVDMLGKTRKKSERGTWYTIKIYPNHNSDKFKGIKTINAINREMKTQVNKNFALIGPISEDNLGAITKTLATRGYNELEYIKVK
ncbi:hypothetical protein [Borrelia sp. RT5S]|uniref:hypothetical protein n=1 Tax=Borrelia sp. RT5S TaxID=2898581 RepID=UPI001E5ED42D|nr:hypothetical protein [Borrelia sp. RT5S]UGQ15812.1 hypothetical protein LSO06_00515 [Borrelia sp. RT5S]